VPTRRLPRRPGERREPLTLPRLPNNLAVAAEARGLELSCAVELCLERALVLRDLADLDRLGLYARVLDRAARTPVRRPLSPAKARYLQMLVTARDRPPVPSGADSSKNKAVVDVPLRLFPRVLDIVDEAILGDCDLHAALQIEIAAVSDGRTMSEWAAFAALHLSL
jgi:hypothetical protein